MLRYNNILTKTRYDGKRTYQSVYYPPVPKSDSDLMVISKEGDYLDNLAYKYYGDPTLYWIIANANGLGKGRMSVPPGMTLRIPVNVGFIISQYNIGNS